MFGGVLAVRRTTRGVTFVPGGRTLIVGNTLL